jgi:hypothetical protein
VADSGESTQETSALEGRAGYLSWRGASSRQRARFDALIDRLGSRDPAVRERAAFELRRHLDDFDSDAVLYLWPTLYTAWLAGDISRIVSSALVGLGLRPDHHVLTVENGDELLARLPRVRNATLVVALLGIGCRSFRVEHGAAIVAGLDTLATGSGHPKVRACAALALAQWLGHGAIDDALRRSAIDRLHAIVADDAAPWLPRAAAALRIAWGRDAAADDRVLEVLTEGALRGDELAIQWNEIPGGGWAFEWSDGDPVAPLDAIEFKEMLRAAAVQTGGAELLERIVPQLLDAASAGDAPRFDLAIALLMREEPLPEGGSVADLAAEQRALLERVAELPPTWWAANGAAAAAALRRHGLPGNPDDLARFVTSSATLARRPAFEGLDDLRWASWTHAYGAAHDIPGLLRGLASRDDDRRIGALDALNGALVQRGTVYDATAAAIPFLIDTVRYKAVRHRESIVELLIRCATGDPAEHVVAGFDPTALATDTARRCYASVDQGTPVFLELLDDIEVRVRVAATYALGWCRRLKPTVVRALEVHSGASEHPAVRASAILALSHLDPMGSWLTAAPAAAPASASPVAMPVAAATLAWMRAAAVAGASSPTVDAGAIVRVIARGVAALDPDPYSRGDAIGGAFPWGDVAAHMSAACRRLPSDPWVDRFTDALAGASDEAAALRLATALLDLTFGEPSGGIRFRPIPPAREEFAQAGGWTDPQRRALRAIVATDSLWRGAVVGRAAPRGRARPVQARLHDRLRIDFSPSRESLAQALT